MCLVGSSPPAKQPAARRLRRMILGRSPLCRLDCTVLYCTALYCTVLYRTVPVQARHDDVGGGLAPVVAQQPRRAALGVRHVLVIIRLLHRHLNNICRRKIYLLIIKIFAPRESRQGTRLESPSCTVESEPSARIYRYSFEPPRSCNPAFFSW